MEKSCQIQGCCNKYFYDGYCRKHFKNNIKYGSPVCRVQGCETDAEARGFCHKHYEKSRDRKTKVNI